MIFTLALAVLGAGCVGVITGEPPDDELDGTLEVSSVPALSDYVVLAQRSIDVGVRGAVAGGDLGVEVNAMASPGLVAGGQDARLGVGEIVLAQLVVLARGAAAGELSADRIVAPQATTGPRSPFTAPPAGPRPGPVSPGTTPVTVGSRQTLTLAAGRYAAVRIDGAVTLSGGLYEVASLRLGPRARLTAAAVSTVRVATGVDVGVGARLAVAPGLEAGALRLVVAGRLGGASPVPTSVLAAEDVQLTALVVARDAVVAGRRLVARGAIAARDVVLSSDGRLTFETGFECAASADCDDGDPCTADACLDAACAHGPATDGTACDDGDRCSVGDACRAGACAPGAPVVTEHPSGLVRPSRIVAGPDDGLWFISPESAPDAADGALARLDPASGRVTVHPLGRQLSDLAVGPDGNLWMAARLGAETGTEGLRSLLRFSPSGALVEELLGLPAERVAAGPDGNVWFASEVELAQIAAAVRPSDGLLTSILFVGNRVRSMTGGPDGNVWMAESNGGLAPARIGRVTPGGLLEEFLVPTPGDLNDITSGADGNLWFSDAGRNAVVRMTPGGMATAFPVPTPASGVFGVAAGPDGALWFTERDANRIGRLAPDGQVTEIDCIPSPASGPTGIARAADGRLWFTETATGKVGTLLPPLPTL